MNQQTTQLASIEITLTAHSDQDGRFLLVSVKANEPTMTRARIPMQLALVIDRSGSMDGEKLAITKSAAAQFINSLNSDDRVAVVTYDDEVNLLSGIAAPSPALARSVAGIRSGGSTDLYGGWVTGAKLAGQGGRVILLSDGLANVGRFCDAASLSRHAKLSYDKFGVTTSTIGVGRDYDEALMAGMARSGAGAHYFAHSAQAITDAFSQERYSVEAIVLEAVSVRCGGHTEVLGHLWGGERKNRVFSIGSLAEIKATVRFKDRATGQVSTEALVMPTEFGHSEEVRLERLLQLAAETEAEMVRVRNQQAASTMRVKLREIVLSLLAHPFSDEQTVRLTIGRLQDSISRLEKLEREFSEEEAVMHRKRSMQMSHNLRERAKAYSSFEDDMAFIGATAGEAAPTGAEHTLEASQEALAEFPIDQWIAWRALPITMDQHMLVVVMEDPRKGFEIAEIEKVTRRTVKAVRAGLTSDEIIAKLRAY